MRLNRRVLVNVAIFAVAFLGMVSWAVSQIVSIDQLDRPYDVSADFSNAFGIVPNAEVTYLGVAYGSVTSIDRRPGGVRVKMRIERDNQLPAEATATVSRKSAIGEPYVDFSPPTGYAGKGPYLRPGDVVPQERTAVPLEFSELLRSAGRLVESVPPEDVATLINEAAAALEGNSGPLRDMAEAGDKLSATFAARTEALDRLAENNTRLTHVVTEHRGSLGASISDLRLLAQTLKDTNGNTKLLLDRGSQLLTQTADLVGTEKPTIDCVLKGLELVVDETTTDRRIAELDALLRIGPKAFEGVWQSRDMEPDGAWIRVGNITNRENPPVAYVPPKALPTPPTVTRCKSNLAAVQAADYYRPHSAPRPSSPVTLPVTGAAGFATGGAFLLLGTLAGRRLRSAG